MKTPQEIKARIKELESNDWMGTKRGDLIDYLPFEDAKEYLKPETTETQWNERNILPPLESAKDYLSFAWEKANNCRGLSAGRSIDHLSAWLWLGGYGDIVDQHFNHYTRYGKKQLVIASILTGFDYKAHDNGEWVVSEYSNSLSEKEIAAEILAAEEVVTSVSQAA